MKKRLLFCGLFLAAFPNLSSAQLELNNSEMLPFGSVMTLVEANDYTNVDTTIQGQGVTWNFTGLTENTSASNLVVEIVDPANTPYGSNYPTSNYAYFENSSAYRYFELTPSKMQRIGTFSNGSFRTFNDPQEEYVFPLNYGTENDDTWDNDASSSGGYYNLKCIGSGTLNLPGGSYQALMVRVNFAEGSFEYDFYFWYDASNGAVLLQLIVGDGFILQNKARFATDITVGNNEQELLSNLKYNNPVSDELLMSFNNSFGDNLAYTISDISGKVLHVETPQMNNETVEIRHNFSSLDKGVYFVSIKDSESGQVIKSVKILKQ